MKIFRLKNGFERMSDPLLLVKAGSIVSNLAGNSDLPDPSPSLAVVFEAVDRYKEAVLNAASGNLQDIAIKNSLRENLILQLHLLSQYVLFQSAGNEVVASSSGFTVSKERQPRLAIAAPEGVVLTGGANRGELVLKCKRVANVQSYQYEITPHPATPESGWQTVSSTVSKNLFIGLQSGKEYCCRVMAIGAKNQAVYSETISRIAL